MRGIYIIMCVLFSGLLASPAFGQEADGLSNIKPLKIGDIIPEELWNEKIVILFRDGSLLDSSLGAYRGKKILLSFWSTTCPSCIESFPLLNDIQQSYTDSFSVVPITFDKVATVVKAAKNNEILHGNKLNTIVENKKIRGWFPMLYVPFYAWVDESGVLIATSGKEQINKGTIEFFLSSGTVDFLSRTDGFLYDHRQILSAKLKKERYGVEIDPYKDNQGFVRTSITTMANGDKHLIGINQSILELYFFAYGLEFTFPNAQIVAKVASLEALKDGGFEKYASDWKIKNTYCLEAVFPNNVSDSSCREAIIRELDSYFNIDSRLEIRSTRYLAITGVKEIIPTGENHLLKLTSFISHMNRRLGDNTLPIVNATVFDGDIYLTKRYNVNWSTETLWDSVVDGQFKMEIKNIDAPRLVLDQTNRNI